MIDLTYSYITLERKREGTHKLKATIRVKRKREERNDGVTAVRYVLINNIILHKRLGDELLHIRYEQLSRAM